MSITKDLKNRRIKRKLRIRKKVFGTDSRLRLSIYRSTTNIYAQLINDDTKITVISASSIDKDLKSKLNTKMTKIEQAKVVGSHLAEKANQQGIKDVGFDRNGYIFRGRVKALADAAREAGMNF
jgi:large subunit ribosomal protein L18